MSKLTDRMSQAEKSVLFLYIRFIHLTHHLLNTVNAEKRYHKTVRMIHAKTAKTRRMGQSEKSEREYWEDWA